MPGRHSLIVIAMISLLSWCAPGVRGEAPFSDLSFDDALKAAGNGNKIVMIDFFTTWCGPCKRLDETTWKDEKVQQFLSAKTIPLKIDAEKQVELAKRYNVRAYPTIVFVKPDGSLMDFIVGYRDPVTFVREATSALAGQDAIARAKAKMAGKENDPMARGQFGNELARSGKYPEALDEYLWCFDNGLEHNRAYYGVRLSFLLGSITQLGQDYPPAIHALQQRRDAAKHRLLNGTATREQAHDFAALCRELKSGDVLLAVYDQLVSKGAATAEQRAMMQNEASELLYEAKRYDDLLEGIGPVDAVVARHRSESAGMEEALKQLPPEQRQGVMEIQRDRAIREFARLYEALLATKKTDAATLIEKEILAIDGGVGTLRLLATHARRAGDTPAAEKWDQAAGAAKPTTQPSAP